MRPINELVGRLESLGRRERLLVLVAVMAVLIMVWNFLFLVPLEARQADARVQREATEARLEAVRQEQLSLIDQMERNPDREARERMARLDARLNEQQRLLDQRMQRFMHPAEMTHLLRDLLDPEEGLRLHRLEIMDPEVVMGGDTEQGSMPVYRHGLLLELQGGYLEAVAYLKRVEQVAGMLGWDHFELEADQHPDATIRIRVHTLSTRKEAIGV